jgi:hypothetical protein
MNESDLTAHLTAKWQPEIILLGGSRALGEGTKSSDWDLYLIGNYPKRESYPEQYQGEHLDIQVRPRSDLPGNVLQIYYGPVQSLRVLKDCPAKLGKEIVEKTRLAYEQGPQPKSAKVVVEDRDEMSRLVAKITSYAADPEACFSHLGIFHRLAIQLWFEKRLRWSLPAHKALPIIRKDDAEFASNLKEISGDKEVAAKLRACTRIQELLSD